MNTTTVIEELEQAARQLGFAVRKEKGNFRGGVCTVDGDAIIMLNKRQIPDVQLVVLADSLREAPIETVYLKPAVRDALEDAWAQLDRAEEADRAGEPPAEEALEEESPEAEGRGPAGSEAAHGVTSTGEAASSSGSTPGRGSNAVSGSEAVSGSVSEPESGSEHGSGSELGSGSDAEHAEDVEAPVSHAR